MKLKSNSLMVYCFIYALLSIQYIIIHGLCPNSCSGHGTCNATSICTCYDGWNGGAADCSFRQCPNGTAWADKAYSIDVAHRITECSNAGNCDRTTGACVCFPGFTGSACQRMQCQNKCSGHGTCNTIGTVSIFDGPSYDTSIYRAGNGYGPEYTLWDKDSVTLCECDWGYFGSDCSRRMCPKGDDPLTVNQVNSQIGVLVTAFSDLELAGTLGIRYNGQTAFISLNAPSSAKCSSELSFNAAFGAVGCTYSYIDSQNAYFLLEFFNWPEYPKENNLFSNDGNPSYLDFFCDTSQAISATTCKFSAVTDTNIKEYVYCSNRGICDFTSGYCNCFDGFGNHACSNSTYLYTAESTSKPGLELNALGYDYTSSVLQISATKDPKDDFYFIEAIAGDEQVFYVQGDGTVGINKLVTLSGGQTVSGGGLFIESGGCTIADQGLYIYSTSTSEPALLVQSTYSGSLSSAYSAMIVSTQSSDTSHFLFKASNQGNVKFGIRADGNVFLYDGGLSVTGGVSINSGGLQITGGVTVLSGGISVLSTGIVVTSGITINSGGLNVENGGLQVYSGGVSIYSGGIRIADGMTITSGGFQITSGVTISSGGLSVTGGTSVNSGGLAVLLGGLSVLSSGINVLSGGLSVTVGGLYIATGGLTVNQGGLYTATSGLTVLSGGFGLTGGLTVNSNGIIVSGGITSSNGGLFVQNGATIQSGGLNITGGITIYSHGASITGGLTTVTGGMYIAQGISATGGLSILSNGVVITGGLSVLAGNVFVSGGMTVGSQGFVYGGLVVTGGLTVYGNTQLASAAVTFSDRRLKTKISKINDALTKVSKINGVYFNWLPPTPLGRVLVDDDNGKTSAISESVELESMPTVLKRGNRRQVGVLAQEVMRVLPEVVEGLEGGQYLGVNYAAFVPVLIEAIHDLEKMMKTNDENESISSKDEKMDRQSIQDCDMNKIIKGVQGMNQTIQEFHEKNELFQNDLNHLEDMVNKLKVKQSKVKA